VSGGVGDAGGVSYGKYQLSSKTGTMAAFLRSKEAEKYEGRFDGLEPGSEEFSVAYQKVAQEDPEGFAKAQREFIKRTHFDPVVNHAKAKWIDVNDPAIQEALWSQSVQHSGKGNREIIDRAMERVGEGATNKEVINALYDARTEYASRYASVSATEKRYGRERKDVLAIAEKNEKEGAKYEAAGVTVAKKNDKEVKKSLQTAVNENRMATAALVNADVAVARTGTRKERARAIDAPKPPAPEKRSEKTISPVKKNQAAMVDMQIPTEYDDTLLILMAADRI